MNEEENKTSEEKNEPIEGTVVESTVQEDTKEEAKKEKSKISEEAENIKNETKETVDKVKDTIKNTDFKKDANETTSFVKEMFFNPFEAVKRAADEENILGKVIILMIVFIAATVLQTVISLFKIGSLFSFRHNFLQFVFSFWRPIIMVLVPSIVFWLFSGEHRKKLVTVISTIVVAYIPKIANAILAIISTLVAKLSIATVPISATLSAVSIILLYFGFKELSQKEEPKAINSFAIALLISEIVLVILSEIGIY